MYQYSLNETNVSFELSSSLQVSIIISFRHPALLPRPSSNCYILEMEHIKLICLSGKCLILNPDQKPTKAFINNLIEQLRCVYKDYVKINGVASMRVLYQRNTQASGF